MINFLKQSDFTHLWRAAAMMKRVSFRDYKYLYGKQRGNNVEFYLNNLVQVLRETFVRKK